MNFNETQPKIIECLHNGKRIVYDARSSSDLEKAKQSYKGVFEYFCSGNTVYIDGVENVFDYEFHFFKRINE